MTRKGLAVEGILAKLCDLNDIDSDVDDIDDTATDSDDEYELHDVSSKKDSSDDVIELGM